MKARAHVKVPALATRGEVIRIKTKLKHPMETGWRKDASGNTVPRKRIHSFACPPNGKPVMQATFDAGVSADPYLSFFTTATESGVYEFTWIEDGAPSSARRPRYGSPKERVDENGSGVARR